MNLMKRLQEIEQEVRQKKGCMLIVRYRDGTTQKMFSNDCLKLALEKPEQVYRFEELPEDNGSIESWGKLANVVLYSAALKKGCDDPTWTTETDSIIEVHMGRKFDS